MLLVLRQDVTWLVAIAAFGVAGLGMGLAYSPLALIVLREASPETPGHRHERPVADRFARHGARDRADRGARGGQPAGDGQPGGGPGGRVRASPSLIGLGGLALTGRLRPRTVPAASLAMAPAPPPS